MFLYYLETFLKISLKTFWAHCVHGRIWGFVPPQNIYYKANLIFNILKGKRIILSPMVYTHLAKKGSATVSKGKRMLLFLIQW